MPGTSIARCLALALAAALLPGAGVAQMLASIPVEATPERERPPAQSPAPAVRVRVHASDVPGLARLLGLPGDPGATGHLDLMLRPGTHADLPGPADATAATFIVDFDDPAVGLLQRRLVEGQPRAAVGGAQVVAFVAAAMRGDPSVQAALASEVARSLQGDCTEHALLTAALARSLRVPARLVQGAALLFTDGRWQAYGHAWVQTLEGGRWIVRDSAMAAAPGPVYYLPAIVVTDEGPGWKLAMLQSFARLPSRIEILDAQAADAVR